MMKLYCDKCGKEINICDDPILSIVKTCFPLGKSVDLCLECQKEVSALIFGESYEKTETVNNFSHPKQSY